MKRENEELMNNEMRAKDWGFNTSKIVEEVTLLYLIATIRKKIIWH